jgi:uncharacterized protein
MERADPATRRRFCAMSSCARWNTTAASAAQRMAAALPGGRTRRTGWSGHCRCTSRTIPSANSCSTGPGPPPTSATACRYYPKLVVARPIPRSIRSRLLLASGRPMRRSLRRSASTLIAGRAGTMPANSGSRRCTGCSRRERRQRAPADAHGFLLRSGCQFHWDNPGYRDFDDFLAALSSRNRKEIKRERRAVAAQGITTERPGRRRGDACRLGRRSASLLCARPFCARAISAADPRLLRRDRRYDGFDRILVIMARHDAGAISAGALFFAGREALYGRHWGASDDFPSLHFELCYYRRSTIASSTGSSRFEAGRPGEYKVRRGFLPTLTGPRTGSPIPASGAYRRFPGRENTAR